MINKIIYFIFLSRLVNIYLRIPIFLIKLILFTYSFYFLWFIIYEVYLYNNYFIINICLFMYFILLNILIQYFLIWNMSDINFILPDIKYTKTYKIYIYILNIFLLWSIYFCNKLIKLIKILLILYILIYNILKYNFDLKLYNIIYVSYILPNIYIFKNLIIIYIYILLSIFLSIKIYNNMYDKILNLNYVKIKWIFMKDKNSEIFIFILYIVMTCLIMIYYLFGDLIILNINLYNFGLFLDIISYIFVNIIHIIILILKYIWIIIKIILNIYFIIYYDLIKSNIILYI